MVPPEGGWTVETLRDYVLAMMSEHSRRHEQRFEGDLRAVREALQAQKELATMAMNSADRAVAKAESATEKRFDAVNEFRETLADQQRTLMPRSEAELELKSLHMLVDKLEIRLSEFEARHRGFSGGWGVAVGIVGFIAFVLSVLMTWRKL